MNILKTNIIEKDPIKNNIRIFVKYIDNDTPLDVIFSKIMNDVKVNAQTQRVH